MTTVRIMDKENIADNFGDLHEPFNSSQAMVEASRCTYCYDAPCIKACPTGIDIPTFIHQIRTGNVDGSAKTILSENIMGGTCARACPTEILCERACVRNHDQGKPVEIGLLQRYAVDHLMQKGGEHPFVRARETGKHIAIIGAGPAGLSCAHRASLLGHKATVFEAKPKPGGLNEYGLAAYKMVDDFAQKEVDFLLSVGGIDIQYNQTLGKNLSLESLRRDYDAVFIGIGLGKCNQLGVPGEDLPGVHDAIEFIEQLRQTEDKSQMPIGNNVVVIGGGNTAIDAAIQSKRLGAETVTLVYRRGEDNMSATNWEIDLAKKNGVVVRLWSAPEAISGDISGDISEDKSGAKSADNKVNSIRLSKMQVENGRLMSTGEHYELQADMVLKAVGQKLDHALLAPLEISGNKISINEHYQTSLPDVFAGGDCIDSGEDLTVQAVEDGKRSAHAMGRALFGIDVKEIQDE